MSDWRSGSGWTAHLVLDDELDRDLAAVGSIPGGQHETVATSPEFLLQLVLFDKVGCQQMGFGEMRGEETPARLEVVEWGEPRVRGAPMDVGR